MAFRLGDPSPRYPLWSKPLLVLFWLAQIISIGLLQLVTISCLSNIIHTESDGHVPTLALLAILTMFIVNALVLLCVLYELSHARGTWLDFLSAKRFYFLQFCKSSYTVLLLISLKAFGAGGAESPLGRWWKQTWPMFVFILPFWTAFGYAAVKRWQAVYDDHGADRWNTKLLKFVWNFGKH